MLDGGIAVEKIDNIINKCADIGKSKIIAKKNWLYLKYETKFLVNCITEKGKK